MKKVIKITMLFFLVLTFCLVFTESVYAKKCEEFSYDECPVPGTDDEGNACKLYVYKCVVNTEAKHCQELDTYQSTDDYGNTCGRDSSNSFYIQDSYMSCSSYTSAATCPESRCKWITNSKGFHECDAIIFRSTTSCDTITDINTCDLRNDCTYFTNSAGKKECIAISTPTPTSKTCKEITEPGECAARTDCDWTFNVKGKRSCLPKSLLNNDDSNNNNNGGNGGIIQEADDFVCSDVKFLTSAWLFIRILSPFLVVLFGSLDFFKAMIANDEKKMKEARGKFPKRLIAFILLILLPFTIQFIFNVMGTYGSQNICLVKCIATNDTSEKGCD